MDYPIHFFSGHKVMSRSNKEKKNGSNKDRRRTTSLKWNRKKKQAK
jgi:hypothetical protein